MTILPINGVKFENNRQINFGQKKSPKNEQIPQQSQTTSPMTKAVPVVMLMAMSPSLLEAKLPEKEINPEHITVISPKNTDALEDTYMLSPQQYSESYGNFINSETIQYKEKFYIGNKRYTMYFVDVAKEVREADEKNMVTTIYFVPEDYVDKKDYDGFINTDPPELDKFVHHDIGQDKEFCGARVTEIIQDKNDRHKTMLKSQELKLPDEISNKIIDLFLGESEFKAARKLPKKFDRVYTDKLDPIVIR